MSDSTQRILIYLSDSIVLDVTSSHLELFGMQTIPVSDCNAMSAALKEALPDVVLIDLDLEDEAGPRWIEKLASDECTAHIPLMCLSTKGDLEDAEEAFKSGAADFLIIPYDPLLLEDKLESLLAHARRSNIETEGHERTSAAAH